MSLTHEVTVEGMAFHPDRIVVTQGDTVIWTNVEGGHSVTSIEQRTDQNAFDSGIMDDGAVFCRCFTFPGTYHYHCSRHPMMTGSVMVVTREPG